jgi:hypothetical protein
LSSVKRIRTLFVVAVLAAVLVLGSAVLAQAQQRTILFVPSQTVGPIVIGPGGITAACTGGAPFTVLVDPSSGQVVGGNCDQAGVGAPTGLVCDDPATITVQFVESPDVFPLSAFVCHAPEEEPEPLPPAPITQETEQEAESGDIDQSFEVTSTDDNSSQCAGVQGVANTGNPQNVTDLLQYASEADEFEFEEVGSDITVSPESPTTCEQQVNQAASASG